MVRSEITGSLPPHPSLTAPEYRQRRIPWFDYYADDLQALPGSGRLAGVKSVGEFGKSKGGRVAGRERSIKVKEVVSVGPTRRLGQVRE